MLEGMGETRQSLGAAGEAIAADYLATLGWHVCARNWRNRYGELRKAPKVVKHIFDHIAPRFAERAGGYTRIVKLGRHRIGDGTELCLLQFVGNEDGPEIGGKPSTRRRKADKRTAFSMARL